MKWLVVLALVLALAWWLSERAPAPRGRASGSHDTVELAVAPSRDAAPQLYEARVSLPDDGRGTPAAEGQAESAEALAFHGEVVDSRTGAPIAGALVRVLHDRARLPTSLLEIAPGATRVETRTGADGRFTLRRAEAGYQAAHVLADGYGPDTFVLDSAHLTTAAARLVELSPSAVLEVRARDVAGRPLDADVEVGWFVAPAMREHSRWNARTDGAGVARLGGLPAEVELDWSVRTASGDSRNGRVWLAPVRTRVLETVLGAGARLAGRVLDERGAPVAGLGVWCTRARMKRTIERGEYRARSPGPTGATPSKASRWTVTRSVCPARSTCCSSRPIRCASRRSPSSSISA